MLTAHQLLSIRRHAPGFTIEEKAPNLYCVRLGRAWFNVYRPHHGDWQECGPWQLVRDGETLEDREQLRALLQEIGIRG